MGKNKNRNRRKKKLAASVETKGALDVQVNISSPAVDYNQSPAVKEKVSIGKTYAVEDKNICKIQRDSDFNQNFPILSCSRVSTNFKGISNETNIMHKDGAAGTGKIVLGSNYSTKCSSRVQTFAEKVQPLVENNYSRKVQPLVENNYSRKVQPLMDSSAKAFPCIKNYVKTKNTIQTLDRDEDFHKDAFTTAKSSLRSISSINGAKPKTNTKQFKISTLSNVNSQSTKNVQNLKQNIQGSVRRNENHWAYFERLYHTWKIERRNTIQKLQKLVEEVHKDQMMFNQGNVTLKEWNIGSREMKNLKVSPAVDFLASLAAFVTDAASSVTSVVQACNVDNYTTKFKEIMENDAGVTRPLYEARSQSLVEYWKVEEIIRSYHSDTFGSTIGNISSTLKVEDLWLDIKNAKGENTVSQIIDSVDLFFKRNANVEKMGEVYNSIQGYLDGNPAALEACKYAGRALYGVFDTWGRDHKQRASIANDVSVISNKYLLEQEKKELDHLRSMADNDEETQAKLESDIHIAISSLKHELEEMSNIFKEKSQIRNNSPWYF